MHNQTLFLCAYVFSKQHVLLIDTIVRCMRLKTFPFMVYFTLDLDALLVEVFALIHTSRNPEIWKQKNL